MIAHVIKNNKVVNTIVIDELGQDMIDASGGGAIGWDYVNGVLSAPEPDIEAIAAKAILNEIQELKEDLRTALVWEFRMIEALWETGVAKGLWSPSDINNTELKQKFVSWQTKLNRLTELGE